MWHLTLYSKPQCTLCDEAKSQLAEFAKECAIDLKIVDISQDKALWDKYQFDIPVLLVEGQEAAKHHIGIKKLRVLHKRWTEGKGLPQPQEGVFPST